MFYKFASFWIEQGQDVTVYDRSTYHTLEWIGDIGGLYDGLKIIGSILAQPIAAFSLKSRMLLVMEKTRPVEPENYDEDDDRPKKKRHQRHQRLTRKQMMQQA